MEERGGGERLRREVEERGSGERWRKEVDWRGRGERWKREVEGRMTGRQVCTFQIKLFGRKIDGRTHWPTLSLSKSVNYFYLLSAFSNVVF